MRYALKENSETISRIQDAYLSSTVPWYIGFSGGKDSSAVLKLTFLALMDLRRQGRPVTVLYCDTGVEIPLFRDLVQNTLKAVQKEAETYQIQLEVKVAEPNLKDRYFSKVIGRGYPPPTNKFRWCTDRLRIKPIERILRNAASESSIVLLGIRKGESLERDKSIQRHETGDDYYFRQSNNSRALIFAPILDYTTEEVWASIAYNELPKSVDAVQLMSLYRKAVGECPVIRDPKGTPCGKGRFGCWTCTVVRKDKSVQALADDGYVQLKPLLAFRNWLMEIRDDPSYRMPRRRNGNLGPGPFTLAAREEILWKLKQTEVESGYKLIENEELEFIEKCWYEDRLVG